MISKKMPAVIVGVNLALSTYNLCAEETKQSKPNVVWLFSDDHAFQAVGAYGDRFKDFNLTPNIDSLASDGVIFNRAYVANSICAPSRATLLTGKHSHINGKKDNRGKFNHNQQQFQKILQKNGYETAMIGKIHLNGKMQGFNYWDVLPGQGRYNNPKFVSKDGQTVEKGHSTAIITDKALDWVENKRDAKKPFMLMVHYKAPHRSWIPEEKLKEEFKDKVFPEPDTLFDDYSGRGSAAHNQEMTIKDHMKMGHDLKIYKDKDRKEYLAKHKPTGDDLVRWKYQTYMRDYLACIAGVDRNIGRILKYLKENGLDKNTIVMYSSDQGFYLGEHGWFDKRFMYEESFRTPLLAKWTGVIKPGTENNDLVQNIDFAETFLDIAGVSIPEDMQGASILPLMKGETPKNWRKSLYYHFYEYPGVHAVRRHEGVATKQHKLIRFYGEGVPNNEEWEFYDLKTDPQEMKSLYNDPLQSNKIAEMKTELQRLRKYYKVTEKSTK